MTWAPTPTKYAAANQGQYERGQKYAASLAGNAARAGLGVATGGTSEIVAHVLNILPSIFQGIVGGRQLKQAKEMEANNPRPEAVIAPSVDKLVNYSYGRTLANDIPGGEMYRNEIKGATSAGLRAASELGSGAEAYGMMGELVGRQQNQFGEMARDTAQQIAGYQGDYMSALGTKAGEENRVWEWNKADPYLQAAQIAQMLRDSGMKNINSGVKNVLGSGAEYLSSTNQDFNSSLMWGKGKNNATGSIDLNSILEAIKGLEKQ